MKRTDDYENRKMVWIDGNTLVRKDGEKLVDEELSSGYSGQLNKRILELDEKVIEERKNNLQMAAVNLVKAHTRLKLMDPQSDKAIELAKRLDAEKQRIEDEAKSINEKEKEINLLKSKMKEEERQPM